MTTPASQRAWRRWHPELVAERAKVPWPCVYCYRSFATARGRDRHRLWCWDNPSSKRFTEQGYRPFEIKNGRAVGAIWQGRNDFERKAIEQSYKKVADALGLPPLKPLP